MIRYLIFSLVFFFSLSISAQDYMPKGGVYKGKKSKYRKPSSHLKRRRTDVFPLDPEFSLNGWFAAFGGTYMFPIRSSNETYYTIQQFNDTTLETFAEYEGKPKGKLGLYAELGWFHSFENPSIFHFFDVGISYRQYKGGEEFTGEYRSKMTDSLGNSFNGPTTMVSQSDNYSDQIISVVGNLTNHYHFSEYGFIQNTIGLNVDYFFSTSRTGGASFPGYTVEFPAQIQAQIHYRFGVGWKASKTLLIIPSVEVPILTAYPFDNFKSSLPYFSTRHYPILFSIRIMLLRPLSEDCVVPEYDGPSNFQ